MCEARNADWKQLFIITLYPRQLVHSYVEKPTTALTVSLTKDIDYSRFVICSSSIACYAGVVSSILQTHHFKVKTSITTNTDKRILGQLENGGEVGM